MSEIKGSEIRLGDSVRLGIHKPGQLVVTVVQGVCTAVRLWKNDELAIQVEGVDDWFYLDQYISVQVIK